MSATDRGDDVVVEETEVVRGAPVVRDTPVAAGGTSVQRRRTTVVRRTPQPYDLVALALAVTVLVLGTVALARTGLETTEGHVLVGWLHHTPALAIAHLVLGVLLLGAAVPRDTGSAPTMLGGLLLVVGIVLTIEPDAFHAWWGTHVAHGVTYVTAGLLLVGSGVLPATTREA